LFRATTIVVSGGGVVAAQPIRKILMMMVMIDFIISCHSDDYRRDALRAAHSVPALLIPAKAGIHLEAQRGSHDTQNYRHFVTLLAELNGRRSDTL